MKGIKILPCLLIFLLIGLSVKAQENNRSEVTLNDQLDLKVIGVDDYANFMNIEGLKKYSNIKYEGIERGPKAVRYTIRSSNKHIILNATYGKDGELLYGRLVTKNAELPKAIRHYLGTDSYKDWVMTNNKVIVRDFDVNKTEYEVTIQQGKMKQRLFFDYAGNPITRLSRS